MSIGGVLGVVFVVLKLCGVIAWSWMWVTLPFWGAFVFWMGFILLAVLAGTAIDKPGRRF
jgi:hypothetical protein